MSWVCTNSPFKLKILPKFCHFCFKSVNSKKCIVFQKNLEKLESKTDCVCGVGGNFFHYSSYLFYSHKLSLFLTIYKSEIAPSYSVFIPPPSTPVYLCLPLFLLCFVRKQLIIIMFFSCQKKIRVDAIWKQKATSFLLCTLYAT